MTSGENVSADATASEDRASTPDDVRRAHEIALSTRKLEIELFWQRSNYFLVLNTAVAVGFFSTGGSDWHAFALAVLGAVVAVLWLLINLGSKFWQSRWEQRVETIEADLPPALRLFSADWDAVRGDVEASLEKPYRKTIWPFPQLGRAYGWAVLKKPSVSRVMTVLSFAFILFWLTVAAVSGVETFRPDHPPADQQKQKGAEAPFAISSRSF